MMVVGTVSPHLVGQLWGVVIRRRNRRGIVSPRTMREKSGSCFSKDGVVLIGLS